MRVTARRQVQRVWNVGAEWSRRMGSSSRDPKEKMDLTNYLIKWSEMFCRVVGVCGKT